MLDPTPRETPIDMHSKPHSPLNLRQEMVSEQRRPAMDKQLEEDSREVVQNGIISAGGHHIKINNVDEYAVEDKPDDSRIDSGLAENTAVIFIGDAVPEM